jgi:hypothetical protein
MTRDSPSPDAIAHAIYTYGSLAHLARAIGVSQQQLTAWRDGKEKMPTELFLKMHEVVTEANKGTE